VQIGKGQWKRLPTLHVCQGQNYDQQVLGVFFSKAQANRRAMAYVQDDLGDDLNDDEEDMDEDDEEEESDNEEAEDEEDDDNDTFVWDDEDDADGYEYNKVWVERRAIEDASQQFHK